MILSWLSISLPRFVFLLCGVVREFRGSVVWKAPKLTGVIYEARSTVHVWKVIVVATSFWLCLGMLLSAITCRSLHILSCSSTELCSPCVELLCYTLLETSTLLGGNKRRWTARTAQPVDVFEPSLHTNGCSWDGWKWRSLNLRPQNLHPGVRGVALEEKKGCRIQVLGEDMFGSQRSMGVLNISSLPSDLVNWNSIIFWWRPTIVDWMFFCSTENQQWNWFSKQLSAIRVRKNS